MPLQRGQQEIQHSFRSQPTHQGPARAGAHIPCKCRQSIITRLFQLHQEQQQHHHHPQEPLRKAGSPQNFHHEVLGQALPSRNA